MRRGVAPQRYSRPWLAHTPAGSDAKNAEANTTRPGIEYRTVGDSAAELKLAPVSVRTVPTPSPSDPRVWATAGAGAAPMLAATSRATDPGVSAGRRDADG
jgi:hypothetical protein